MIEVCVALYALQITAIVLPNTAFRSSWVLLLCIQKNSLPSNLTLKLPVCFTCLCLQTVVFVLMNTRRRDWCAQCTLRRPASELLLVLGYAADFEFQVTEVAFHVEIFLKWFRFCILMLSGMYLILLYCSSHEFCSNLEWLIWCTGLTLFYVVFKEFLFKFRHR